MNSSNFLHRKLFLTHIFEITKIKILVNAGLSYIAVIEATCYMNFNGDLPKCFLF